VASIARDDPSPLPGMHRDHNAKIINKVVWTIYLASSAKLTTGYILLALKFFPFVLF